MTKTQTPAVNKAVVATTASVKEPEPPIEPFGLFEGWLPVFTAQNAADIDKIKALGHSYCYVLGHASVKDEKTNTSKLTPQLFKMVNTDFAYALLPVGLDAIKSGATITPKINMNLPLISWKIVEKMERFFRGAYEKVGTEAAVMLTYDLNMLGAEDEEDGWDFFVPTQSNTSHACDYEMEEIVPYLEEYNTTNNTNRILIGSAHSHPNMSAYASDVDHKDQKTFEGLHFTIGWKNGTPGVEWYAELILSGKKHVYPNPLMLFEGAPIPEIDFEGLEVEIGKVAKEVPKVQNYGNTWQGGGRAASGGTVVGGVKSGGQTTTVHSGPNAKGPTLRLPNDAPDVRSNTIIAILSDDETECRFCSAPLTPRARDHMRCYACSSYFINPDSPASNWSEIHVERQKINAPNDLNVDPMKATLPIVLWHLQVDDQKNKIVDVWETVLTIGDGGNTAKK